MKNAIEYFKKIRKKKYLAQSYSAKYAFVGMDNHRINTIYVLIDYLNVPLKYLVSKTSETANLINHNYPEVIQQIIIRFWKIIK